MPGPEIWAPSSILPDVTDVTWRRVPPLIDPVNETETGVIELPDVAAATGKFELSVFCNRFRRRLETLAHLKD